MTIPGHSTKLNVHQSVFVAKSPNLMSAKCTTTTVHSVYACVSITLVCVSASVSVHKWLWCASLLQTHSIQLLIAISVATAYVSANINLAYILSCRSS